MIGRNALVDEIIATETESDQTPFWLIKATKTKAEVPVGYKCPCFPECDVSFDYPQNDEALEARRLKPIATGRGEASTTRYVVDLTVPPFLVPCLFFELGRSRWASSLDARRHAVGQSSRKSSSCRLLQKPVFSSGAASLLDV